MTRKPPWWYVTHPALLGLMAGFLLGSGVQAVGTTVTLMTAGTTIVLEGNLARARSVAIANGKRNALELAVNELIHEGVALENYDMINRNIYHRHEVFIDTYRILAETSRGDIYEVTLESVVAMEKLRTTLVDLGLMEEELFSELSYFRLIVSDVSCSPCLKTLKAYLQDEMAGVQKVSLYSISPGVFTLNVAFRGGIEEFRYVLTSTFFEGFRLDTNEMDESALWVQMVLPQPEDLYRRLP